MWLWALLINILLKRQWSFRLHIFVHQPQLMCNSVQIPLNLSRQLQFFSLLLIGNLKGEDGAAERTVEDVFIRRFMFGTFHGCLANEIVIKRRGNLLNVCAVMLQKLPPQKFYFLIGYTESLLSHFYKCPVKLEIQTLQDKIVYKYLWLNCP